MMEQERRDQELRREGFRAGMAHAHSALVRRGLEMASNHLAFDMDWHDEAIKAYPITRTVSRLREVRLDGWVGRYRFRSGYLEYEVLPGSWQLSKNTMDQWTPSNLRALAELKEHPTEMVEVAE